MATMPLLTIGSELQLPTVLLRHTLTDGSQHVDWMIARDGSPEGKLVTFRLPDRLDALPLHHHMPIEHIADHRRAYLHYEGPISRGRGQVVQLATGEVLQCDGSDSRLHLHLRWQGVEQFVILTREKSPIWLVKNVPSATVIGNNASDGHA